MGGDSVTDRKQLLSIVKEHSSLYDNENELGRGGGGYFLMNQ